MQQNSNYSLAKSKALQAKDFPEKILKLSFERTYDTYGKLYALISIPKPKIDLNDSFIELYDLKDLEHWLNYENGNVRCGGTKFVTKWFDYKEAEKIAKELKVDLEVY